MVSRRLLPRMAGRLYPTSQETTRTGAEGGKRMSRYGKAETQQTFDLAELK